jgi:RNA polymerase sigma-70 factor (ECF subfamily)
MEAEADLDVGDVAVRTGFDPFFHLHFEKVARAAAFVARDAGGGQELAQEAFIRLYERWDDMSSDDHARNFAYKVAINLARSYLRKQRRLFLYGLRGPDEQGVSGESSEDWFEIVEALGSLSPRQRACVVLVDYVDMDSATAATVLGVSPSTVRVHLTRARRALREGLGLPQEVDRA